VGPYKQETEPTDPYKGGKSLARLQERNIYIYIYIYMCVCVCVCVCVRIYISFLFIYIYIYIYIYIKMDRLCGLVVRVLGYRSGGPGSIPGTNRKKKKN
jgi:hypothetical protein